MLLRSVVIRQVAGHLRRNVHTFLSLSWHRCEGAVYRCGVTLSWLEACCITLLLSSTTLRQLGPCHFKEKQGGCPLWLLADGRFGKYSALSLLHKCHQQLLLLRCIYVFLMMMAFFTIMMMMTMMTAILLMTMKRMMSSVTTIMTTITSSDAADI